MSLRGLVLAGGQSKRFGRDKALALHQGKTYLETAVSLLEAMDVATLVVTRQEADYSFLGYPVLKDKLEAKGPLGGIYSAMSSYPDSRFLILTCDMPVLNSSVLSRLISHQLSGDIVVYAQEGAVQPFPGIYSAVLLGSIIRRLQREDFSMKSLIEGTPNTALLAWEGEVGVFANVNHQADTLSLNSLTA